MFSKCYVFAGSGGDLIDHSGSHEVSPLLTVAENKRKQNQEGRHKTSSG